MAILSIFLVEVVVRVVAHGWAFFRSAYEVFDAAVIITSFALDVAFRGDEFPSGVLIILRLWRVVRPRGQRGADEPAGESGSPLARGRWVLHLGAVHSPPYCHAGSHRQRNRSSLQAAGEEANGGMYEHVGLQ